MLNGEPSEFAVHQMPSIASVSTIHGTHATLWMEFNVGETEAIWTQKLDVDSPTDVSISMVTPFTDMAVTLLDPSGNKVDLSALEVAANVPFADSGFREVAGTTWRIQTPVMGAYTIQVTASSSLVNARRFSNVSTPAFDGIVSVYNDAPQRDLRTWQLSSVAVRGAKIGLAASIVDAVATPFTSDRRSWHRIPSVSSNISGIKSVVMEIETPSQVYWEVPMVTDGGVDGEVSASIVATEVGTYQLAATVVGVMPDGTEYMRTSEHSIEVDEPTVGITAVYATHDATTDRLTLILALSGNTFEKDATFKPYVEVWGVMGKTPTPLGFAHNLATVQTASNGLNYLTLEFDLRWFVRASVAGCQGLRVQNVWVSNAMNDVVLTMGGNFDVKMISSIDNIGPNANTNANANANAVVESTAASAAVMAAIAGLKNGSGGYNGEITKTMRRGIAPKLNTTVPAVTGKVLVIHGYCATKNPFQVQSEDWTDAIFYDGFALGHSRSRSNQQFAEDVLGFIADQGLTSFSSVGQSQGGMIQLHILNYYHTGLDATTTGRRVQSCSTPYGGVSAYGSLNNWASMLYPDCIPPSEFNPPNAAQWEAGITAENMNDVFAYRTQYGSKTLSNYCDGLINTFLSKPNDGAVEVSASAPANPGTATLFPVTAGQCHKEDMKWPAAYFDRARNNEMSANAARK